MKKYLLTIVLLCGCSPVDIEQTGYNKYQVQIKNSFGIHIDSFYFVDDKNPCIYRDRDEVYFSVSDSPTFDYQYKRFSYPSSHVITIYKIQK